MNLDPKTLSRLQSIFLSMLFFTKHEDKYSHRTILAPLIDDLKILEKEGITIQIDNGNSIKFYGTCFCICGDNLGLNGVGGFVESFTEKTDCCRFCSNSVADRQKYFRDENFQPRTKDSYEDNLIDLDTIVTNRNNCQGVKFNSIFNDLIHFHVTTGLPSDIMHDILQGAAAVHFKTLMGQLERDKVFTMANLVTRLQSLKYGCYDGENEIPLEAIDSKFSFHMSFHF